MCVTKSAGMAISGGVGGTPVAAMWMAAQIGQSSSGSPGGTCRLQSDGAAQPLACALPVRARSPACTWPNDTQSCSSMARRPTAAAIRRRDCHACMCIGFDAWPLTLAPDNARRSRPENQRLSGRISQYAQAVKWPKACAGSNDWGVRYPGKINRNVLPQSPRPLRPLLLTLVPHDGHGPRQ